MTLPPQPPPPPPSSPQPTGWIDLTIQGNRAFSNMIVPSAYLNGHPVPTRYGQNVFPVPPGPWRVELAAQWWKKYGEASIDVHVTEGQTVPVFYAAPLMVFGRGNIGPTKQKIPGVWFYWALLAFVLAIVVLVVLAAVLS